MSKLLNRGNMFVVIRTTMDVTGAWANPAVVGAFTDMDQADDYRGACEQQWLDKVGNVKHVNFEVQLTTYYG